MTETIDQWREPDRAKHDENGNLIHAIWNGEPDRGDGYCLELIADRDRWVFNEYMPVGGVFRDGNDGKHYRRYSVYISRKRHPDPKEAAVLGWEWLLAGYGADAREGTPVDAPPGVEQ